MSTGTAPVVGAWELGDILCDTVRRAPGHPALIVGADRRPVSYGELSRAADQLAARLREAGLRRGDVVALQASNSAQFVTALLAAARAGIVVAPLDPAVPIGDKRRRVDALGARATLVDKMLAWDFDSDCPDWLITSDDTELPAVLQVSAPPRPAVPPRGLRGDDALIMMTSGTSGTPKLVPWTHQSLAASINGIASGYGLGAGDATVAVMPLFHGHGLVATLLATLGTGGTLLLPARGKFSAHSFWDDITAAGATWYTAVPTIHQIMVNRARPGGPDHDRAFPPLRFIRSCSAPLSADVTAAIEATFHTVVVAAYGMTETTHQASSVAPSDDDSTRLRTVGTPTTVTARITAADGSAAEPGAEGEIWLRGSTVARGYLGASVAQNASAFTDGWFRTGDLGTLDAAGHLSVTGRIKNLINRGGEKISPERVEAVLLTHPDITGVAVVGVPDDIYGERVASVIAVAKPITADDVTDFCRTRLAPYEIPEVIEFSDELPVTAKGDVDRAALPELIEQLTTQKDQ